MSFGALSRNAKAGVGLGATRAGTSTTTGDGGMHPMEREHSDHLVYQICPSHYGNDARDMARADAVEIVVGQGAKPGTGGVLLGAKVSDEVAAHARLPLGVDQRSPVRHPDFIGPADMRLKIEQIREATDWQVPVYVKIGAARVRDDVKLAAKAGADVIVVDGMEGGSAATPDILYDHTGIPTLAAICEARRALEDMSLLGEVQIVLQGGIKNGADVAKALALGADAVGVGSAILIALGCNSANYVEDYHALGVEPGHCAHCHTGLCPVGITTQDERPDPAAAGRGRGRAGRELPQRADPRDPDVRPRLRQAGRARPGARGPADADPRGVDDHGDPAGRLRRALRPGHASGHERSDPG